MLIVRENSPGVDPKHTPIRTRTGSGTPASAVHLTDWRRAGNDSFHVSARWGHHPGYLSRRGTYDPMLLCETFRQCALFLARGIHRTPANHHLAWTRLQYSVNPYALRGADGDTRVDLHLTCADVRFRGGHPASMTLYMETVRGGDLLSIATLGLEHLSVPLRHHDRARQRRGNGTTDQPPSSPTPSAVGRTAPRDVVLSATPEQHCWQLRVPPGHPSNPAPPGNGHVPPMVLMEALRQATLASLPNGVPALLTSVDAAFLRPVELGEPCWFEAEPDPGGRSLTISAIQRGALGLTAATETTVLAPLPRSAERRRAARTAVADLG
ncbi:AfsA-related hotdog domain-containing protein [Streptomyces sp. ST2-7A]|uniref:AfsA-related hotdog domain-containing protein n=1 Tax=Streptomyces sp. ST2-7A TaxID=2907214 RepID=UPI001F264E2E|nr:AfsA-related hotdog domain-containing protein [Streptomyces sp. ST2-7A]MCE7079473.1 transcriptional regulator [Streptomyces sp. ST2-7A]